MRRPQQQQQQRRLPEASSERASSLSLGQPSVASLPHLTYCLIVSTLQQQPPVALDAEEAGDGEAAAAGQRTEQIRTQLSVLGHRRWRWSNLSLCDPHWDSTSDEALSGAVSLGADYSSHVLKRRLDAALDRLPHHLAYHLEVLWLTESVPRQADMPDWLHSVLMRAHLWHGANILVVPYQGAQAGPERTNLFLEGMRVHSLMPTDIDFLPLSHFRSTLFWRGDLAFMDPEDFQLKSLPGFELVAESDDDLHLFDGQREDVRQRNANSNDENGSKGPLVQPIAALRRRRRLCRRLKVQQMVDLLDVPPWLLTGRRYTLLASLFAKDNAARAFLEDDTIWAQNRGIIVKLDFCMVDSAHVPPSSQQRITSNWNQCLDKKHVERSMDEGMEREHLGAIYFLVFEDLARRNHPASKHCGKLAVLLDPDRCRLLRCFMPQEAKAGQQHHHHHQQQQLFDDTEYKERLRRVCRDVYFRTKVQQEPDQHTSCGSAEVASDNDDTTETDGGPSMNGNSGDTLLSLSEWLKDLLSDSELDRRQIEQIGLKKDDSANEREGADTGDDVDADMYGGFLDYVQLCEEEAKAVAAGNERQQAYDIEYLQKTLNKAESNNFNLPIRDDGGPDDVVPEEEKDLHVMSWPDVKLHEGHGIHYNTGLQAEQDDRARMKFQERHVGLDRETVSTINCNRPSDLIPRQQALSASQPPKSRGLKADADANAGSVSGKNGASKAGKRASGASSRDTSKLPLLPAAPSRRGQRSNPSAAVAPSSVASGSSAGASASAAVKQKRDGDTTATGRQTILKKLIREVTYNALQEQGINEMHKLFKSCFRHLYDIVLMYANKKGSGRKDLKSWLEKVASKNAANVVDLEQA